MAQVVLVHGIAQEQLTADGLEAQWLPALAGGVRAAGHPELADRIWRASRPGDLQTRMAYYGDLFRTAGAQGLAGPDAAADAWGAEQADLAEQWGRILLQAAAERGSPKDRAAAVQGLRAVSGDRTGAQGVRGAVRPVVEALTRVPWFAPFGVALAGRTVVGVLDQVTRYLTDDTVRSQAVRRVTDLIDDTTRLVIGHSLGSVVAFEALHQVDQPVALVTIGSPLGVRGVVYDRVRPQPPVTPATVRAWTNVADVDDLVAVALELRYMFPAAATGPIPMTDLPADNGARPHDAVHYLGKKSVGLAVAAAMT